MCNVEWLLFTKPRRKGAIVKKKSVSKIYTRTITRCFFCPHYEYGNDGINRCYARSDVGMKLRDGAIRTRIDPRCPLPDAPAGKE